MRFARESRVFTANASGRPCSPFRMSGNGCWTRLIFPLGNRWCGTSRIADRSGPGAIGHFVAIRTQAGALRSHRYREDYFEAIELLVNPGCGPGLQSKRKQDAVADSVNLNIVKATAQQIPGCCGWQIRQRYLHVKPIATRVSFVVIQLPV